MRIVILDTDSIGADLDYSRFGSLGTVESYPFTSPEQIPERVGEAECLVLNKVRITPRELDAAPRLRLVCVAATGYENLDLAACRERGVAVCNVKGYSTDAVAQLTLAMALHLSCRLPEYTAFVNSGDYAASGLPNRLTPVYHELAGRTWGVVGWGAIGQAVGRVAEALGCRVLFSRQTPTSDPRQREVDELCRTCDVISLHTPLTPATRGLISRDRLAAMKEGTLLINVARGAVTDEAAVADALLSGHLGGLGCDVFSREPFGPDHPFWALRGRPDVCLTPHMAWGAVEARERVLSEIQKNISAFTDGDIRNRVDML